MMQTRILYYDTTVQEFTATITESFIRDAMHIVVLDQTAFYPESGGQPADHGTLDGVPVTNVWEEGDIILHQVTLPLPIGSTVGKIDWRRRQDHMQQHSGQHILSQSFQRLCNAETISFHLGSEIASIDLQSDYISAECLDEVENLANQIVYNNLPVVTRTYDSAQVPDARKISDRQGDVRMVHIGDFDVCPCGGTHVTATGEIGMIKLRKAEKTKAGIRIEFLCGNRALKDYRWKNQMILKIAAEMTIKDREVYDAIQRIIQTNRDTQRTLQDTNRRLSESIAMSLIESMASDPPPRIIREIITDMDLQQMKSIAMMIAAQPGYVILLGTNEPQPFVVFTRSDDLPVDMNHLIKETLPVFGGKGGGNSKSAQGGSFRGEDLEIILQQAEQIILR